MGRPKKCRRVDIDLQVNYFKPRGVPIVDLEQVQLTLDELEALRLADLLGMSHEEAGNHMRVSRATFGRIIERARKTVADALTHGKAISVEGGNYRTVDPRSKPEKMMKRCVYGPVPSRRLGLSLGLDVVPYKVCSYDCVYCQLGRTKEKTIDRKPYIPVERILDQLYQKLKQGVCPDYITVGGSGEPTLNSQIGTLIHDIKQHTQIPVAVLTNGSLLWDGQVRESIMEADVVLPSLDSHDQEGFDAVNRPHPEINFEAMAGGLITFRNEYPGEIWLEVFILEGINATEADAVGFKHWIERVNPEKVHLNTAVRPTAEAFARQVSPEDMANFCTMLGQRAEIITPFEALTRHERLAHAEEDLLSLLSRRPCTLDDIAMGLNVQKDEILKLIQTLVQNHTIDVVEKDRALYYRVRRCSKTCRGLTGSLPGREGLP